MESHPQTPSTAELIADERMMADAPECRDRGGHAVTEIREGYRAIAIIRAPASGGISITLMPWRKRCTHRAAI